MKVGCDAGASEASPKMRTKKDGKLSRVRAKPLRKERVHSQRARAKRMQEDLENLANLRVSRDPTLVEYFTKPIPRTLVTFRAKPCKGEAKPCDKE